MIIAERLIQGKNIAIKKWILLLAGAVGNRIVGLLKIIGGLGEAINDVFAVCGYGSMALLIYSFDLKVVNEVIRFGSGILYEWY